MVSENDSEVTINGAGLFGDVDVAWRMGMAELVTHSGCVGPLYRHWSLWSGIKDVFDQLTAFDLNECSERTFSTRI